MQCILITGSNGFIGGNLCRFYRDSGYKVVGIGNEECSLESGVAYYSMDMRTEKINGILRKYKPSVLIHCAGNASVPLSMENPLQDFELNTELLYQVIESCREAAPEGLRIVNLSSAGIYGNPQSLPIHEDAPSAPISPYALNKWLGEEVCKYYRKTYGMDIVCVRIFSAYGPGLKKQLFWDMYQKIKKTGELKLYGTGNESRDFIYIADLVNAIHQVVMNADASIINVANGKEVKIKEIAEIFANNMGIDCSKICFNHVVRSGDPLNWCADVSLLKACGYQQRVDIHTGISEYVKWVNQLEN